MFKVVIISFFSLLVLLPACRIGVIYGYYFLNQAYITQEFCVNIAEPALMCSGKCYVNEWIEAQTTSTETPIPAISTEDLRPVFQLIPERPSLVLGAMWAVQPKSPPAYQEAYRFLYVPSNFKPPQVF